MPIYESLSDLPDKHRDFIAKELGDEEFILGTRANIGDVKRNWPRLILTDNRFIVAKKAWIQTRVRGHPLSTLTEVDMRRTKLTVKGMGDVEEEFRIPPDDGERFARALQLQMADASA